MLSGAVKGSLPIWLAWQKKTSQEQRLHLTQALTIIDTLGRRKQALAAQFDADVDDFLRENEELKDKVHTGKIRKVFSSIRAC